MKLRLSFLLTMCGFAALLPVRANAQHWVHLFTPLSGNVTPYFINENVGFIYDGYQGRYRGRSTELFSTTNGGTDFYPVDRFSDGGCAIVDLSFTSLAHGFILVDSSTPGRITGMVFETMDTGKSWTCISPATLDVHSMYAVDSTVFITAGRPGSGGVGPRNFQTNVEGQLYCSRNDRTIWDSMGVPAGTFSLNQPLLLISRITGNRDSLVCLTATNNAGENSFVFSSDLGQTWHSNVLDDQSLMGTLYCMPHSCEVIRLFIGRQESNADVYAFYKGVPPYDLPSWQRTLREETGGWVAGNRCALYIGNALSPGTSTYRSLDAGSTWQQIDDPNGNIDFTEIDDDDFPNLSVAGYGAVVFACNSNYSFGLNGLWKTTDGGDGSLSEASLMPKMSLSMDKSLFVRDTLFAASCRSFVIPMYAHNERCAIDRLKSVQVTGLDPSEYSISRSAGAACATEFDTASLVISPSTIGMRDLTILAHFEDDEFASFDTSFTFTVVVSSGANVTAQQYFKSSTITARALDTVEFPVYWNTNPVTAISLLQSDTDYLSFKLNTDLLTPLDFVPANSRQQATIVGFGNDTTGVRLSNMSPVVLADETLIGTLRCKVMVTDTITTDVQLTSSFGASPSLGCVKLSEERQGTRVSLIAECGNSTFTSFLASHGVLFSIKSLTPNPASDLLTVHLNAATEQPTRFIILDAVGHKLREASTTDQTFTVNVQDFCDGVYSLRVQQGSSSSEKKFVIAR